MHSTAVPRRTASALIAVLGMTLVLVVPSAWAQPERDVFRIERDSLLPSGPDGSAGSPGTSKRPHPGETLADRGIYLLDGKDPGLPYADLEPLRHILNGASVVGLGETIHTSGGYYTMKHRLFRFLVERMHFRAFAIESNWIAAEQTARYVDTCAGSSTTALRGLFGVWQSTEVRDLVEWMCQWNQENPRDPVTFFGFDIQEPELDGPALIDFLQRTGLQADDPRIAAVQACDGVEAFWWPELVPDSTYQACHQGLNDIDLYFEANRKAITDRTSREELERARIHVLSLRAWEDESYYEQRDFDRAYEARDRGMATAFQRLRKLKVGSAKTAVWAHNEHISTHSDLVEPFRTMGTFLEQELGHAYAAVALTGYDVGINWLGIGCGGPFFVVPGAVEELLHESGEDYLLVDLGVKDAGHRTPFLDDGVVYWIGQRQFYPSRQFDAIVYLEQSPYMNALRWTCEQANQ
ncbi:MAG TPA: erythromycin esterase family protein [Thermoanaerobaculia bacterium]|nr:erythromycin esterase family protein [Thermoanaerobaculia bacterium]